MIADLINSNGLRIALYGAAAAVCLVACVRERRSEAASGRELWPPFWLITLLLLAAMGLARLTEVANLAADVGRSEARESGWYEARRPLQALAVAALSTAWLVTVFVAIWRVPERRRRYLPAAIVAFSLLCFAAVRAVSLHHLDQVLYNRPLHGVRLASIAELGGTALMIAVVAGGPWLTPLRPRRRITSLPGLSQ